MRRINFKRLSVGLTLASLMFMSVCIAGPLYAYVTGARLYVITGGSMEPTYSAGDAVLVHRLAREDMNVGRVVTFRPVGSGSVVTHRITAVHQEDTHKVLQTKGDGNSSVDPALLPDAYVLGTPGRAVPSIGQFIVLTSTPMGRLVVFGIPLAMVALEQVLAIGGSLRVRQFAS